MAASNLPSFKIEPGKQEDLESGIFNASRELLFKTFTDPKHIPNWWGPSGFTSTIHKMEFQPGVEWNLRMHGPNGTNYPNKSIFKEIIPHEKIVFEHRTENLAPGEGSHRQWALRNAGRMQSARRRLKLFLKNSRRRFAVWQNLSLE